MLSKRDISLSLTNLIVDVHFVDSAKADRRKGHDAVFDRHAVGLEGDEKANLARNCFVEVALGEFENGEEDDGNDPEDREEKPVELVKKSKVWATFDDKATFSISDQYVPKREENVGLARPLSVPSRENFTAKRYWLGIDEPEDHVEEDGVEVDTEDNCSAHLKELTPKLVLVRLPETCIATLNNADNGGK